MSGAGAPTPADLAALPKVELHVHLEGTIRADTAAALARRHGEDPGHVLPLVDGDYPHRFDDFPHFVRTFVAVSSQVRAPEDLRTVAAAFAQQQVDQGVRYSEVTFTAKRHVDEGMEPAAMWQALREGFASVADTQVRLIVDAVRDLGPDHAAGTIELVADADAPIAALGLSGVEGSYPERDFRMLRDAADELGLGLAVHAGETGSADNVRAALDDLGADRIGHGVAAIHDPALCARLAEEQVVLEVCPSSNVVLGVVPSLDAHPLARLWRAGVAVTVNSDDPPFFGTSLTDELAHAARLVGLDRGDLATLQRRAARAAFTDEAVRGDLVDAVDRWERTGASTA